jgi:hypothetical protein
MAAIREQICSMANTETIWVENEWWISVDRRWPGRSPSTLMKVGVKRLTNHRVTSAVFSSPPTLLGSVLDSVASPSGLFGMEDAELYSFRIMRTVNAFNGLQLGEHALYHYPQIFCLWDPFGTVCDHSISELFLRSGRRLSDYKRCFRTTWEQDWPALGRAFSRLGGM